MLILLNVLRAVAYILDSIITIFLVVLFARVILSWIRLPYNPIVHAIYKITEPVLSPIRRKLPMTWGIDFSPMILFLLLFAIRIVVVGSIFDYVELYRGRYLRP
ncbi:YggT family protein [bacterium]|nr:YggT family protein [bacterium]MCI0602839.1 YggT family protein [bacterium]